MGKPSDARRSARRPGRRERTRAKKARRGGFWSHRPHGGGAVRVHVPRAGRKKFTQLARFFGSDVATWLPVIVGDSATPESRGSIRRPLYTVELVPVLRVAA